MDGTRTLHQIAGPARPRPCPPGVPASLLVSVGATPDATANISGPAVSSPGCRGMVIASAISPASKRDSRRCALSPGTRKAKSARSGHPHIIHVPAHSEGAQAHPLVSDCNQSAAACIPPLFRAPTLPHHQR